MAKYKYSENALLDLELRFKSWPDVTDLIDTIRELNQRIEAIDNDKMAFLNSIKEEFETVNSDLQTIFDRYEES